MVGRKFSVNTVYIGLSFRDRIKRLFVLRKQREPLTVICIKPHLPYYLDSGYYLGSQITGALGKKRYPLTVMYTDTHARDHLYSLTKLFRCYLAGRIH